MNNTKITIDYSKIGTKGFPHNWKELGLEPPTITVKIKERQTPENEDVTTEEQA